VATITEGVYRISLASSGYGDQFLTAVDGQWVALLPPDDQWPQQWDIRSCDDGYTIGQASTEVYVVYDDAPDLGEPITLASQPCAWTITEGPQQSTVSFGVPGISYPPLSLGLARSLVYPTRVALSSPPWFGDQGWTLIPA
jgi:hypothetical protein